MLNIIVESMMNNIIRSSLLSNEVVTELLAQQRLPLYNNFRDFFVDNKCHFFVGRLGISPKDSYEGVVTAGKKLLTLTE